MRRLAATLAPLLLLLAPALPAQVAGETEHLPAVEAPPELSSLQEQKLKRHIKALRNSNPKARAKAEAKVIDVGRGAIPLLIEAATTDHEGKQAGIETCLVALADIRDRDTVEDGLTSELVVVRRFAARAAGTLATRALLDAVGEVLDDEDVRVRTLAALSLAGNGREESLPVLVDTYVESRALGEKDPQADLWSEQILAAVAGLADAGDHRSLIGRLDVDAVIEKEEPARAAAIRLAVVDLLAAIGDEAAVRGLGRALDESHNIVQQRSINAIRQLVEGKEAFQGATFQQIKEIERLKGLLAGWRGFPEGDDRGRGRRG